MPVTVKFMFLSPPGGRRSGAKAIPIECAGLSLAAARDRALAEVAALPLPDGTRWVAWQKDGLVELDEDAAVDSLGLKDNDEIVLHAVKEAARPSAAREAA